MTLVIAQSRVKKEITCFGLLRFFSYYIIDTNNYYIEHRIFLL